MPRRFFLSPSHRLRSALAVILLSAGASHAVANDKTGQNLLISGTTGAYYFVNDFAGAGIFYGAEYFGATTVIANVEGGHIWAGHEVFDRSAFSLPSGPTHYVSHGSGDTSTPDPSKLDLHATAVGHVLAGTGWNGEGLSYLGVGMAPFAELWSGAIATEFSTTDPGAFSITTESFLSPYKTFFNGDLGRKPDVINSSWGYTDPAGNAYETKVIDGLAKQNSTVAMVFAAGNSGPDANTVGGAGTGYNVITVGSVGGPDFKTPSTLSSSGPSDFYKPETGDTIAGVRATVHLAAPGEQQVLAYYGGTGGSGGVTDPEDPLPTDLYLLEASGTSFAAPIVSGGIALLKDVAYQGAYSLGSEAFDSRVMRSVLMAGTVATHGWNNGQTLVDDVVRTTQSLDHVTGAGALDLTRSVSIYALGTSDVAGTGGGSVDFRGWDFGTVSLDGYNDYFFSPSFDVFEESIELTISLNWFVNRSFDNDTDIASEESFANLNLEIWSVTDGVFNRLIGTSESLYNNSEFLRMNLQVGEEYGFRVRFDGVIYDINHGLFEESYSVAWMVVPEPSTWALMGMAIVICFVRRRGRAVSPIRSI